GGNYATVGGGYTNNANGQYATIGGGNTNTAGGDYATVGGGDWSTANGNYSFAAGRRAKALHQGAFVWADSTAADYESTAANQFAVRATGGVLLTVDTSGGGLQIIPNAAGPNLIGGYSGNTIAAGLSGATINGGGEPGYINTITGTGNYATIAGGSNNTAGGTQSAIGGGATNSTDGYISTVAGGRSNTAGGDYATVAGGWGNIASGYGSAVTGGFSASATHFGEQAHASGQFAVAGDAQASTYVLRREYAMAAGAWHDLFLDGNGGTQRLTIASGRTVTFDILISGRTAAGESGGYRIEGVIENVGGVTALIGTPTVTVLGEDDAAWNVQVLASDTLDALLPQVQGNGETIRWVATVQTSEVSW
ncbi:MAG: hypothetical protein JW781_02910, partial [Deltaproteobacteria bacterium]|nr:hypothetical protein [Candidatus Anaeroferrophillacea bacterium]